MFVWLTGYFIYDFAYLYQIVSTYSTYIRNKCVNIENNKKAILLKLLEQNLIFAKQGNVMTTHP